MYKLGLRLHPACRFAAAAAIAATLVFVPSARVGSGPLVAGPKAVRSGTASGVERVAVFGRDARKALPKAEKKLHRGIGILYNTQSHSVCTAFCAGDATIGTAAHCIYRTSGEEAQPLAGFSFRLGRGTSLDTSRIAGARQLAGGPTGISGTKSLSVRPPIDATSDWAFVRLETPICRGKALPIVVRAPEEILALAAQGRVNQAAFHKDFGHWELALGQGCAIERSFGETLWPAIAKDFSQSEHLILHTCATGGGSSGSPLLVDGPDGPEVIGINVGTYLRSHAILDHGEVKGYAQAQAVANTGVSAAAFAEPFAAFQAEAVPRLHEDKSRVQRAVARAR